MGDHSLIYASLERGARSAIPYVACADLPDLRVSWLSIRQAFGCRGNEEGRVGER